MASEVANNSTGIISPSEAKNILNQLGEASKKIALSGTDVLSNFSGEIREGLKQKLVDIRKYNEAYDRSDNYYYL